MYAAQALKMRRWGKKGSSRVHGGKFANYSNAQLERLAARDRKAAKAGRPKPSKKMGRQNFKSKAARRADARKRSKAKR